jgi:AcrR family transcriptional regulator
MIAAAGIAIADAEGIDALSMRKVAAELGCGTMSLYRHVTSKDELLDVMIDAGVGETSAERTAPTGDWRQDLRQNACDMRAGILRHPWLVRVIGRRPALGPNMLAVTESTLSAVDGLGLSIDQMLWAIGVVNAFVVGFVVNELAERTWRYPKADQSGPESEHWATDMIPYMQSIIDSGDFPLMTRLVIEAEDFPDPEAVFAWQLDRVLDGLAAIIPPANPDH